MQAIIRTVKPDMIIQGVEMIGQKSVGVLLGTKSSATVSEWLTKAGLTGISINNRKYYSTKLITDYLTYQNVELREAVELLRQIKIMQQKVKKGENKTNETE